MKDQPTIKGRRVNSAPSWPERHYVYNGDDKHTPKPVKEVDDDAADGS